MTPTYSGCLLVANQTAGGPALRDAVQARIADGRGTFYVLVPQIEPAPEASGWTPMQTPQGLSASTTAKRAAVDEAGRRSLHRLDGLLKAIRAAGGEAEGTVSSTNAVTAVRRLLPHASFEEILVCTLPAGISRWTRLDVPTRIARLTDVPVTVVHANP